ncbi:MAG: hypothetical protein KDA41_08810, partial [Planctomycetales bacterium]|nr:hypothetical protein [Planctomycetales bacterium]
MMPERIRTEDQICRRTMLVDVPSGAALAELRMPSDRRGWVVVAHDGAHDPASVIADLNRNGLATLCLRHDGGANAKRLVETFGWLKRSVAEAQGLPIGLLGFGAAASAALSAAAVLGKRLGGLVAVNASPDLAKTRFNDVNTFSLFIADAEHAGVNRRAAGRAEPELRHAPRTHQPREHPAHGHRGAQRAQMAAQPRRAVAQQAHGQALRFRDAALQPPERLDQALRVGRAAKAHAQRRKAVAVEVLDRRGR